MNQVLLSLTILLTGSQLFAQTYWKPLSFQDSSIYNIVTNKNGQMAVRVINNKGENSSESIYFSGNFGATWKNMNKPEIVAHRMEMNSKGQVFISDDDGHSDCLIVSKDVGETWENISDTSVFGDYSLGISPDGIIYTNFFYRNGMDNLLASSTDNGKTWTKVEVETPPALISNLTSQTVYVFDNSGNAWYMASNGIYRLETGTGNWLKKSEGMKDPFPRTLCITSENRLFTFTGSIQPGRWLYRSDDLGETWENVVTTGLPQFADFTQMVVSGNALFGIVAGTTEDGVYGSFDGGKTWKNVSAGLELPDQKPVPYVLAVSGKGELLCGTWYGLYKSTGTLTSLPMQSIEIPSGFLVSEGYPNPFNPSVSFKTKLPENGQIRVQVIDLLGRTVQSVTTAELQTGDHNIDIDFSGSASGIYFVRVIFGNSVETRKVQLVK